MDLMSSKSVELYTPEKIGMSMKEVGSDIVEVSSQKFRAKWFTSDSQDTEIHVWTDEETNFVKIQILHLGSVVEWTRSLGIRTGITLESELLDKNAEGIKTNSSPSWGRDSLPPEIEVSHSIVYDSKINDISFNLAQAIIMHSQCLDETLRIQMRNLLVIKNQPDGIVRRVLTFLGIK